MRIIKREKTEMVSVRLPDSVLKKLKELAKKRKCSMTEYVHSIFRAHLLLVAARTRLRGKSSD